MKYTAAVRWTSGSDGQYDLSRGVSAATEFERLFRLLKWKNRVNERPELAVVDELCDGGEALAVGLDADHPGAPAGFPCEVLPRLFRQRHQNAAFLKDAERPPLRIAAHGVKHNVRVANVLFKARRLVVDRVVAAELSDQIEVVGSGSGADHSCAVRLGELHRHRPDSTGRRVDEHRLPRAQVRGVKQRLVRSQRADGYGCRAGKIERLGLETQRLLIGNGKLRIRAVAQQIDHAEDLIAT